LGYHAPTTDSETVRLIGDSWGPSASREKEQIEIIDIRQARELHESWKPMICREHYNTWDGFYDSLAAQHPRRSCEDFFEAVMQNNPQKFHPIPHNASWEELENWVAPLLEQERENPKPIVP
jgi:hypothetical protein